jgi:hypothetical protein
MVVLGGAFNFGPAWAEDGALVLDVVGRWVVQDSAGTRVRVGRWLPPGATVRLLPPVEPSAKLTLVASDGKARTYSCATPGACEQPITLEATHGDELRMVDRVLHAIGTLLGHDPERYISPLSRGSAGAADAIVVRRRGSVDLAPTLGSVAPGALVLRMEPLTGSGGAHTLRVEWRPGKPAVAQAQLPAGVYRLRVIGPGEDPVKSRGDEAWVLVCDPPDQAAMTAAVERVRVLTDAWGESAVSPSAARGVRRAYLEYLATRRRP